MKYTVVWENPKKAINRDNSENTFFLMFKLNILLLFYGYFGEVISIYKTKVFECHDTSCRNIICINYKIICLINICHFKTKIILKGAKLINW